MIRFFYLLLLTTFPFSICYNYGGYREENYRPNFNSKVKGRRKYYSDESDGSNLEGYSDDKEPMMAQLNLVNFLKKSNDYFSDDMPKKTAFNSNNYNKNKRGIFTKKYNARREYLKNLKLSKDAPQFVSVDKVNPKRHGTPNSLNSDVNIQAKPTKNKDVESVSEFTYEDDNTNGIKRVNLNINSDINNNVQERNAQSRKTNANSDTFYDDKNVVNIESNIKKQHNVMGIDEISGNGQRREGPTGDVDIDSHLLNKDGKVKIHKTVTPRNYNLMVFDRDAQRKNFISKESDSKGDVVYQDGKVKSNKNINDKIDKKKVVKRFRFPFFYHNKSDTKRNKKRKLFCGCNCAKKTGVSTTSTPVYVTEAPANKIKLLKRSYEEKICPICKIKFISEIIKTNEKGNPMIHNSRQFFKTLGKTTETSQELGQNKDDEEIESNVQNYNEDPGDDELENIEENNSYKSSRNKREKSTFDRDRQLKELEEVQRKIDSVQIKGIASPNRIK